MPISSLLPDIIIDEPIWKSLFETMDLIVANTAETRIKKFKDRHNIESFSIVSTIENDEDFGGSFYVNQLKDTSDEVELGIRYLSYLTGFNLQDYGKLEGDSFLRMVESTISYIPVKGTNQWVNFFSYIIGKNIQATKLWYDHTDNVFYSENTTALESHRYDAASGTKTAYPSPYVDLELDPELLKDFTLEQIFDLVYSIAPFDVVIRNAYFGYLVPTSNLKVYPSAREIDVLMELEEIDAVIPSMPAILKSTDVGYIFKVEPSKVFTNTAGTTNATYGDEVARINSKSSSSINVQQATAGIRPIFGRVPKVGRKNLFKYSNSLNNAYWVKNDLLITENVTETTDPSGTLKANLLRPTSVTGEHFFTGSASESVNSGVTVTLSFAVKPKERSQIFLRSIIGIETKLLRFDSTFGNIISNTGYSNVSIENLAGNWKKITVTITPSSTVSLSNLFQIGVLNLGNISYTGDNASGLYISHMQYELGSSANTYQLVNSDYDISQIGSQDCYYLNFLGTQQMSSLTSVILGGTGRTLFVGTQFKPLSATAAAFRLPGSGNPQIRFRTTTTQNQFGYPSGSTYGNLHDIQSSVNQIGLISCNYTTGRILSVLNNDVIYSAGFPTGSFVNAAPQLGHNSGSQFFIGRIFGFGFSNRESSLGELLNVKNWLYDIQPLEM